MLTPLVAAVRRLTDGQPDARPILTAIDGLAIFRSDHERSPEHRVFRPALCVVVQGAKWVMFGDQRFDYRAGQVLVVNVALPLLGRVAVASPTEPYLGLVIEFDLATLREVYEALNPPPPPVEPMPRGLFVVDLDAPLADCAVRLVRLLDTPEAISVLQPLIVREICYWLLAGPHGGEVARLTLATAHPPGVLQAIHAIRDRFVEPVRVEELAALARLSESSLHRQFKAITALTPLQYQKRLRLLEARRLLMTDAANVEGAALQVGYESPSQFNREYTRMFGAPPRRDIAALRTLIASGGSAPSPGWG